MRRGIVVGCVVLAVAAYVAFWEGCFGACSCTTDGVYYMRFAERMLGNGADDGWFAAWPVGYPAVLAAVRGISGIDVFVASKFVGVVMCAGMLFLFHRFGGKAFPLLAIGLLNLAFLKIWRGTLSEQCFIPALVLAGFVLSDSRKGPCVKKVILWAGLFLLVFMFRYVGVFAPIWAMGAILFAKVIGGKEHGREAGSCDLPRLIDVCAAGCVAWIFEGGYLLLNKLHTGHVTGMVRVDLAKDVGSLARNIAGACCREVQVFVLIGVWLWAIILLSRGYVRQKTSGREACSGTALPRIFDRRELFFVGMGAMYLLTMVSLSVVGNFNELGFRLLYPGTIMIVIGVSLAASKCFDVAGRLNSLSAPRFVAYLALIFVAGCNLLSAELAVRRLVGVDVYGIGEPYLQKKHALLEKYKDTANGSVVHLNGLGDPDFFIGCLRPDLRIDLPEGRKKY